MSTAITLGPRVRTSLQELGEVHALLEERTAWLRGKGVAQWQTVYPVARFTRDVETGSVWHWTCASGVAGTVTLLESRPEYYPEQVWQDAARVWYLCRLAVSRRCAGAGLGSRLLEQIEADAASAGLRAVRLDVAASNPFLEGYYSARGYRRLAAGEIKGDGAVFMEKPTAALRADSPRLSD